MRYRLAALATIAACSFLAPTAFASSFKLFGAAAYIAPLSDTDVQSIGNAIEASDELGWNAGFEWRFVEHLGLEVDVAWADSDIESSAGTFGSIKFQPAAANLNFHFFPDRFFDLYVGGGYAYTVARAAPVLAGDGSVREWIRSNVDITARRLMEEALQQEAEVVETLSQTGAHLVAELDLRKLSTRLAEEGVKLTGATFGALFRRECPASGPGGSRAVKDGGDNECDGRQP